jgi:Tol biopolymer transport system component
LSHLVNPYRPGEPVEDAAMFFGRDDALIWVEQQITLDRRLLIVHGPDLIGKTSLIRRLDGVLSQPVRHLTFECRPFQGESLSRSLAALAHDLLKQLADVVQPSQVNTALDSATAVKSVVQPAAAALGDCPLLLTLDDAHLLGDSASSLPELLDFLTDLLAEVPTLHVLATLSDLSYGQLVHPLLGGASDFRLGPLSSETAHQLITRPMLGALRFDTGVVKRIAEINSNHPYYLQLFCQVLYTCCARDGWVNQSDVDVVLNEVLAMPNQRFQDTWDQSTWPERAALAALAGRRGAHGPITRQEVLNYLCRFDKAVVPAVILDALESLSDRAVLVRMGALSYRFAVNLFRYWLDRTVDLPDVLAHIDWERLSARPHAPAAAAASAAEGMEEEEEEESGRRRGWGPGQWAIAALSGTALIGLALLGLASGGVLPAALGAPSPTATEAEAVASYASPTPSAQPPFGIATATPVPTPTPTRPVVVARVLPAIAYMARSNTGQGTPLTWQIFAMNADGTNRQQWTQNGGDDSTPVWSPDGRRIAFVSQRDGNREIYTMPVPLSADQGAIDGPGQVNITQSAADDWTPAWSPDGRQIAFASIRQGNWEVFIANADGSGLVQVTDDGTGNMSPVWSPDGQTLAYASKRDGNWEIYTMPAPNVPGARGEQRRLTASEGNDLSPVYSPQGDRIAFESNREGNVEIYVMGANGANPQNLTHTPSADDHGPVWSPDGQRLLFYSNRTGNWDLFVMSATGENVINLTNTPDIDELAPAWRP